MEQLTLVDAHVHIHPNFNLIRFFNSAFINFEKAAKEINSKSAHMGVLFLTESQGLNYFEKLCHLNSLGEWNISKTSEGNSLIIDNDIGKKIAVIAGRQIVTSDRLEVLALGLTESLSDGKNVNEIINWVTQKKGLPVIPWGVGKWLGNRGEIVNKLITEKKYTNLFLGDNGNRPAFLERSQLFRIGIKNNKRNLPGSDPLPFKKEETRAGSFGFFFHEFISERSPYDDLKNKLLNSNKSLEEYGELEKFSQFIQNQIRMQIKKYKT